MADLVTDQDLAVGRLYPPQSRIKECSVLIAARIMEDAYKHNTASTYPEPEDKIGFIHNQLYDFDYDGISSLPHRYSWPAEVQEHFSKL